MRYRLVRYVLPTLGPLPLDRVAPEHVLALLRKLADRPETARRALQFTRAIYRYAIAHGLAASDPTAAIAAEALPPRVVRARAAPTHDRRRLAELVRAIRSYQGSPIVRGALEVALLTAARPGEVRGMRWAELDLEARVWRIPAERLKGREPHLVFLAPRAVAILEGLRPLTASSVFVFPSLRSVGRPLSENTLNAALRTLGFGPEEATAHGFRAIFSTIANEEGADPDVVERCLAHRPRDAVRAAYHRAEYLPERRKLMDWWGAFLDALADGAPSPSL
ncbi:MAG: site-specific integrase [Geminicoccaceae bacterium]|nr:site-specific integrase [Geminicoccaceae bacterium]